MAEDLTWELMDIKAIQQMYAAGLLKPEQLDELLTKLAIPHTEEITVEPNGLIKWLGNGQGTDFRII